MTSGSRKKLEKILYTTLYVSVVVMCMFRINLTNFAREKESMSVTTFLRSLKFIVGKWKGTLRELLFGNLKLLIKSFRVGESSMHFLQNNFDLNFESFKSFNNWKWQKFKGWKLQKKLIHNKNHLIFQKYLLKKTNYKLLKVKSLKA